MCKTCSTLYGAPVQAKRPKKFTRLAEGVREGQNLPQKWPKFGSLNGSSTPEMNSNQSWALGGGGSLAHLGASGRLQD